MPGGDRTGPNGLGARTGRRLGYCMDDTYTGFGSENYEDNRRFGFGRRNAPRGGRGFGLGRGLGFRHGSRLFHENQVPELKEETLIENEINSLKDRLLSLETRLKTLKDE